MMEPVAYISEYGMSKLTSGNHYHGKVSPLHHGERVVPLVRLSDAEARIAELQAKIEWLELEAEGHDNGKRDLAEVLNCADEPRWKYMRLEAVKLKARAEAAEARLKKLENAIDRWAEHDGECGYDYVVNNLISARAIHDKIGAKDE